MGRGHARGRGGARSRGQDLKKNPPGRPPSDLLAIPNRIQTIVLPVTAQDEEIVECSECHQKSTFREFRIHNIEVHYNIAKPTDDPDPMDHKYLTRKLIELAKITKITTFFCPRKPCTAKYKSALGLAFHLGSCGKSKEEFEASLLECDICQKKYTVPNMYSHKKTAHPPPVLLPYPGEPDTVLFSGPPTGKRKSAMKAMEFMKEISDVNVKTEPEDEADERYDEDEDFALDPYHLKKERDDEEEYEEDEEPADNEDLEVTPSIDFFLGSEEIKANSPSKKSRATSSRPDFAFHASRYLESLDTSGTSDPWDSLRRVTEDPLRPFISLTNSAQALAPELIRSYLPVHEKSLEFNTCSHTKSGSDIKDFHRLNWFEGEITSDKERDFITFAGGPISAMAWHPSSEYLAVATLHDVIETPNMMRVVSRPSSIQLYVRSPQPQEIDGPVFSLRLVICTDFGYANQMKWSTFWPTTEQSEEGVNISGYLAAGFEDSTIRIYTITFQDLDLCPTFASDVEFGTNVPVYSKVPEMTLRVDDDLGLDTGPGQCITFDWDEGNRFIVAGFASGHIAVFDLFTKSPLLRTVSEPEGNFCVVLNPTWLITCHLAPVTAIVVDPKSPRYFYTGSMDRTLRTWDMNLKLEVECKKVGCVIDMCWIRGWVHLALSNDMAVPNLAIQFNSLRFHAVGNSQSRSNIVEYFNICSTSFFEGMVLTGSENGRVAIAYYDAFWRECDYDRNKKKKNVINIGKVVLDETSFNPVPSAKIEEDIRGFPKTEEPRVTLVFCRDRIQGSQETEPTPEDVESVCRFYKYIRVNKVCWSPNGKYLTVGYRNGLCAILPAEFDRLFT